MSRLERVCPVCHWITRAFMTRRFRCDNQNCVFTTPPN